MNVSLKMSLRKFTLLVSTLIATSLFVSCPVMGQVFTFPPDTVKLTQDNRLIDVAVQFPSLLQYSQIKEKSSPRLDLRHKIGGLIVAGSTIYIFRDDLQKWGNRNDKLAHLFLSYGLTKFFGWKFALGFMLSIEATQTDIFGIGDRYEDTIEDIFVDVWAIGFAVKF